MNETAKSAITRREFATRAALAGAAATLGASPALAQTPASSPVTANVASTSATPSEPELRIQTILGLYGSRFSETQIADLRKMSSNTQKSLDRLRAFKVENSDDPALYLKPLVEREKKASAAPVAPATSRP
jgi:nitrous oxide reductase